MRVDFIILSVLMVVTFVSLPQARSASLLADGRSAAFCAEPNSCVEQRPAADREGSGALDSQERAEAAAVATLDPARGCSEGSVKVRITSPEERFLACAAIDRVLKTLSHCSLSLVRMLDVRASDTFNRPNVDALFGFFDPMQDTVFVPPYARIPSLISGTPYESIPQAEFYKSLVTHEIVHGVMHQNARRAMSSQAANEYPAYALQIESMPAHIRNEFLSSFDPQALTSDTLFSDIVLALDPFFFAARAYMHYKRAPNGCLRLASLLNSEPEFIAGIMH